MRGTDEASGSLFSYVDLAKRIPASHPLRKIRQIVNDALTSLDTEFDALYTDFGRPWVENSCTGISRLTVSMVDSIGRPTIITLPAVVRVKSPLAIT